ncbi:hypothetical protein RJ639_046670 [Escallonia herrerae]|uniref:Thaumatin-like protein n=1 Tax=Escallonia herrerae TaxID=1293975 RepID=A0AA89B6P0_9ASTE|nr:hypothetical protein RJ639_046670 [Escallonia herrerae]
MGTKYSSEGPPTYCRNATRVYSAKLKLANDCSYKIWPVLASCGGKTTLSAPALVLQPGKSTTVSLPTSSSGRLWGRTFGTYNSSIGRLSCLTEDCGSGLPECAWAGALPPVTIVQFELNGDDGLDWYVVRASRGNNLGILVVPQGGSGGACKAAGYVSDVNGGCESETGGACNCTCFAFSDSRRCCTVSYGRLIPASRVLSRCIPRVGAPGHTVTYTETERMVLGAFLVPPLTTQ